MQTISQRSKIIPNAIRWVALVTTQLQPQRMYQPNWEQLVKRPLCAITKALQPSIDKARKKSKLRDWVQQVSGIGLHAQRDTTLV